MTLEAVYSDKAKIPQGLEAHYIEVNGEHVLDVPGMKTQADFDRYAEALKKRFTDAGADFARKQGAGLSRDDVLEVVTGALQKFAPNGGTPPNGGGGKDGQDPEVVQRLHDLERDLASLKEKNETLEQERDRVLGESKEKTIRNKLTEAAAQAGVTPEGVPNLVSLVANRFEVAQDGTVVTKLDAGDGVSPNQNPGDYLAGISRDKSFRMFWPESVGAGADSGSGSGSGNELGAANPWSKAGWNLTAQGKLYQSNRDEADRLMKAAGVTLGATTPVK